MDPIPFYVVKDLWDYVALAVMAVGALASAFAAGVALWLGVLQHRPSADTWVGLASLVGNGTVRIPLVQFRLVNTGSRRIVVKAISWHVGREKVAMLQLVEDDLGATVPTTVLADTDELWRVRLKQPDQEPLLESLAKTLLMPAWQRKLDKLHVRFHTAIGKSYTAQLDAKLRAAFTEACERVEAAKAAEKSSTGPAAPTAGTA